jgi:hypothetical protein
MFKRIFIGLGVALVLIGIGVLTFLAGSSDDTSAARAVSKSLIKVGVDSSGRSHTHVAETISTVVPSSGSLDLRTLPLWADGSSIEPRSLSVDGARVTLAKTRTDLTVTVHAPPGSHTFKLEYDLDDVLRSYGGGNDQLGQQELYLDLIPKSHPTKIEDFSATIAFDSVLSESVSGDPVCYKIHGKHYESCGTKESGNKLRVAAPHLKEDTGVTVSVPFRAHTAILPPKHSPSLWVETMPTPLMLIGVLLFFGGWMLHELRLVRSKDPEELESNELLSPLLAGELFPNVPRKRQLAAELVYLKDEGCIDIAGTMLTLNTRGENHFDFDEQLMRELFNPPLPGSRHILRRDAKLRRKLSFLFSQRKSWMLSHGLTTLQGRWHSTAAVILGLMSVGTAAVLTFVGIQDPLANPSVLPVALGAVVTVVAAFHVMTRISLPYLTRAGAAHRERLFENVDRLPFALLCLGPVRELDVLDVEADEVRALERACNAI